VYRLLCWCYCYAELIDPLLYDIYRKDRLFDPGHEGGGVLNAIRKDVISSGEITLETDCELAWNKIQIKGSKPLYTGCFAHYNALIVTDSVFYCNIFNYVAICGKN
jgi:hypothetical protein